MVCNSADNNSSTFLIANGSKCYKTPEHLFRLSPLIAFFCLAMNAFVGNLVTLQPNNH